MTTELLAVFAQLASYLDAERWPRRAPSLPVWTSDRSSSRGGSGSGEAETRIIEALLAGNATFLGSWTPPPVDKDLAARAWEHVAMNTWRVPPDLCAAQFLGSGFAADEAYRLTVHHGAALVFDLDDELWGEDCGSCVDHLRDAGVVALFASAPHLGWAVALPCIAA